jgi:hypothetical protein
MSCLVDGCDRPVMVTFQSTVHPLNQHAVYESCPVHVDSVIAREQDELHDLMAANEGTLTDWWYTVSGEPRPEPEVAVQADSEPAAYEPEPATGNTAASSVTE